MTEDTTTDANQAQEENNVQISVEQICAAILATVGSVEVSLENLVANYGNKTIAVNQNEETKAVTFALVDMPAQTENVLTTEQASAE
jgi:hypothetical protein